MPIEVMCPRCYGSGREFASDEKCIRCEGTGRKSYYYDEYTPQAEEKEDDFEW